MKNNRGQALVEYILIIAVISVITIGLVRYFGGYVKDSITKTSCSLMNEEFQKGKKPGEGKCVEIEEDEVDNILEEDTDNKGSIELIE